MNEPGGRAPEQHNPGPKIAATIGAAAILILSVGAACFLIHASPEALAATWWAVTTTSLVGVVVTIYVVAARQSPPGSGDDPRPTSGLGSTPPMDDVDAELFRILADARLGDISTRRAHGRARGPRGG